MRIRQMIDSMGIRNKLIAIFVAIKVVPLVLLAWYAWQAAQGLGDSVSFRAVQMADAMRVTQQQTGKTANEDAVRALDERSREAIEAQTTDLAKRLADFLYDRDKDLLAAATLDPSDASYRRFLAARVRETYEQGDYKPSEDGKSWVAIETAREANPVKPPLQDNSKEFHIRLPEDYGKRKVRPLFLEMSFVDTNGVEKVKIVQGEMQPGLRDISRRENTFVKAETYWPELKKLKPGELYVSEVIGAYVRPHWVGPYTPARAEELKKPFKPEESGYAGLENPLGKRFKGIVRWATPVTRDGKIVGYVTLALDHAHIMAFSNNVRPTEARFAPLPDPASGNYAFIWDHKSRSISHARDYFITGYDPQTGHPVPPFLDGDLWAAWKASDKPWHEFLTTVDPFSDQSLRKKPAPESAKSGNVGLDCRYLNFSPQCHGWHSLTEFGGSGSFVIFFSGLWKLTTAATIPYYSGQYASSKRGFGYVTIGANVDDFHKAATESGKRISALIATADEKLKQEREGLVENISDNLRSTAIGLTASTVLMVVLVIGIAIWMANVLTNRITEISSGIRLFQDGNLGHRLEVRGADEMAELSRSFNGMADAVQHSFGRLDEARLAAEEANRMKSEFLANMSHELRTPLNGILGFAELLELELTDPAQQEYAQTIRASGQHLLAIVTDVLDLAKIEAGRMEFSFAQIHLPELLQEVVAVQRGHAMQKGLTIEVKGDIPPEVHSDLTRLRQVLLNITNNAVKFTNKGHVSVRAKLDDSGERVRIEVEDTGVGIKPEDLNLIFEEFRQSENFLTRSQQGTGLGLALARNLVKHMDGEIGVNSVPELGSTFYLVLPVKAEDKKV